MDPSAHRHSMTLPYRIARLTWLPLVVFLLLIVALLWLTLIHDKETQRNTLISDALWMGQSLQFQFDRNAAQITQVAPELVTSDISPQTDARVRQILRADTSLIRIIWLNAEGRTLGTVPSRPATPIDPDLIQLARNVTRPVYGPVYEAADGGHQFKVYIPAFTDSGLLGITVGVYSLEALLTRELPWWFTQRYRVSIVDSSGDEIAARAHAAPLSDTLTHSMAFEPPGRGLQLQIVAYREDLRWMPVLLTSSILGLAAVLLWSFWMLRRQLVRRVNAEQALRGETLFRKAMEDSLLTGLRARDLGGRITYANPAFCNMVGYTAEELIGMHPPMPYWHPDHIESLQKTHDMILSGQGSRAGIEVRFIRRDGDPFDALIFEAPLIDANGHHTGWMGSIMDITERKRIRELARQQEERLHATSRLVTMGEMASTLAHELNQPLAAISTYNSASLNLLSADETSRDELHEIHTKIARQTYRAAAIIHRVHDFVRRSEPKRERVQLNDLVREAIELMNADAHKRQIDIKPRLSSALPEIDADPIMLEQLIVNLVRNAMDASVQQPRKRRAVSVTTDLQRNQITLAIADRGDGIPLESAKRLFEPFFSTKQEGMGMGLNICRSIAELHHGRLTFEPRPGGGTVFTLTLPVEQEPVPE